MDGSNKLPPHSIESEQSVLGSVLIDPSSISLVSEILKSIHFYDLKNRLVFDAMLGLFDKAKPIDLLTLEDQLKKQKQYTDAGGKEYITSLIDLVPTSANIEHYALIVRSAAIKREIISMGSRMVQRAFDEGGDVNELLNEAEAQLFALSQSHTRRDFQALRDILTESFERLEQVVKGGQGMRGVATGFRALDNKLAGMNPSNMIVIAARPSIGKTTFALNIANYLAVKEKKKVGFFSLEMSKEELVDRLLVMEAQLDSWKLRTGRLDSDEMNRLTSAMGRLAEAPIFIDDTPALSVNEMRTKARKIHMENKIDVLIVDYLQLAVPGRNTDSRVQEVSIVSQAMKNIARELKIPVITLSQLSSAVEQRGGDGRPQLSDLRDSGSIEQDADVVMFLYRADEDDDMLPDGKKAIKLYIAKHRNGPTGEINFIFQGEQLRFYEIDVRSDEAI